MKHKRRLVKLLTAFITLALSLTMLVCFTRREVLANNLEFITSIAIASTDGNVFSHSGDLDWLKNNKYTVPDGLKHDLNNNAGGYYIHIGYQMTTEYVKQGSFITGLVLVRGSDYQDIDSFTIGDATYKKIRQGEDSDGDFNQGAGGDYVYLFYTNYGADTGAPILITDDFYVAEDKSLSSIDDGHFVPEYNPKTGEYGPTVDLNANTSGGDTEYLHAIYHSHTMAYGYNENQHWHKCTSCQYQDQEVTVHTFTCSPVSDQHIKRCSCGYSFYESHTDNNDDGLCDECGEHLKLKVNNIGFISMDAAWPYAQGLNADCTLTVLEDYYDQGALVNNSAHTITINSKNNARLTLEAFSCMHVYVGKVILNCNLTFLPMDNTDCAILVNTGGTLDVSGGSITANPLYDIKEMIRNMGTTYLSGGSIAAPENTDMIGIFQEDEKGKIYLDGGKIEGFSSGVKEMGGLVQFDTGSIDCDEVLSHYGGTCLINNGNFVGAICSYSDEISDSSMVTIKNAYLTGSLQSASGVSNFLYPGVCLTNVNDANQTGGNLIYVDTVTGKNQLSFTNKVWIHECREHSISNNAAFYSNETHKGICDYCNQTAYALHDFDDKGLCVRCGVKMDVCLTTNAGTVEYYPTVSDAFEAIGKREDTVITLLTSVTEASAVWDYQVTATLDFNGNTLTLTDTDKGLFIKNGVLHIKNGTLDDNNQALQYDGGTGTIENMVIKSWLTGIYVTRYNTEPPIIYSAEIHSQHAFNANCPIRAMLLPGYTMTDLDGNSRYWEIGSYTCEGDAKIIKHENHTYEYENLGDGSHRAICNGCTYKGDPENHTMSADHLNVCNVCGASFTCDHDFLGGTCKKCSVEAASYMDDQNARVYYLTLSEAVKAADGKTATVGIRRNLTETSGITVPAGMNLTLDFTNSTARESGEAYILKVTSGPAISLEGGTLNILNGTYISEDSYALTIQSGTCSILSGTFKGKDGSILCRIGYVKSLIQTGYYFADPETGEAVELDSDATTISCAVRIGEHTDHTGCFENGICKVCNYVCPHTDIQNDTCMTCGMHFGSQGIATVSWKTAAGKSCSQSFDSLQEAIAFAKEHLLSVVTLNQDLEAEEVITIDGGAFFLNLKDHKVTGSILISGTGTIIEILGNADTYVTSDQAQTVCVDGATVIIAGGTYANTSGEKGAASLYVKTGKAILTSGTFLCNSDDAFSVYAYRGSIYLADITKAYEADGSTDVTNELKTSMKMNRTVIVVTARMVSAIHLEDLVNESTPSTGTTPGGSQTTGKTGTTVNKSINLKSKATGDSNDFFGLLLLLAASLAGAVIFASIKKQNKMNQ